jgi:predicted GIY-YIG superfamily endonuclease
LVVSIGISKDAGWSSLVARQAHNLKVASSNLAPATNFPFGCREFIAFTRCKAVQAKFYIGLSENVTLRVQQHNAGLTRSTRGRGPWKLVWQSDTLKLSDARRLEFDLKRQKGGNGFYQKTRLRKL